MENRINDLSMRNAALLAGVGYLMMMTTPFSEFYALPRLIVPDDGAGTLKNMIEQQPLLRYAIFGYVINFIGDTLAAWALYILLRPVHKSLSLLACLLRLIYTVISVSALLNLVSVLAITKNSQLYDAAFVDNEVMVLISTFRNGWKVAYIFFGLYLSLLGYLIVRSGYIPKWIGIFICVAGVGWLADNLQPLLYPDFKINFIIVATAGLGELVLMFWLFIKGPGLKEINSSPG